MFLTSISLFINQIMQYFIDWLTVEQDHGYEIPESIRMAIFDKGYLVIDLKSGEVSQNITTGRFVHKGSFCDSVSISINGSVVRMEGNPSRWGRVDNLVGFKTIDECISKFNSILFEFKIPPFTRCTKVTYLSSSKPNEKNRKVANGAIIKRIDITTNFCVGKGNEEIFLKALSQNRYRNSKARLHTDGCTVDWLSDRGNAFLIYPSVYIKHREMQLHSFRKIMNALEGTEHFNYFLKVLAFCEENGVIRFEQKIKSKFLQRNDMSYWGISDFSKLEQLQKDFVGIVDKMKVVKNDVETIAEQLLRMGVVDSPRVANNTSFYAMKWFSGAYGESIGLKEAQFKVIRARLRKIGIDIQFPCDVEKRTSINVISCKDIFVKPLVLPDFYRKPSNSIIKLRKVA